MNNLLAQIKELEQQQNDGRGVDCVRTVIMHYERNDIESAANCCINENDKIRNYPELQGLLRQLCPDYNAFLAHFETLFPWTKDKKR